MLFDELRRERLLYLLYNIEIRLYEFRFWFACVANGKMDLDCHIYYFQLMNQIVFIYDILFEYISSLFFLRCEFILLDQNDKIIRAIEMDSGSWTDSFTYKKM